MIDDIIFDTDEFILEMTLGVPGGIINSYSMDGSNYDTGVTVGIQTSLVFIT